MNKLRRILNIALISALAVLLTVVVRNRFSSRNQVHPGSLIALPGVHFPAHRDSLVLGISATCHFCRNSLPFYKQLTAQLQNKVKVVAVLPQPQSQAQAFVSNGGLVATQVVSHKLAAIGIVNTPTLLIVSGESNGKGKVQSIWVGELDQARQRQLLGALLPNAPLPQR